MTVLPDAEWLADRLGQWGQVRVDTRADAVALVSHVFENLDREYEVVIKPQLVPHEPEPEAYLVVFELLVHHRGAGWLRGDYLEQSIDWTEANRPEDVPLADEG